MDGWSDLFISDNIEQQQFNWNMNGKEKGSRKTTTTDEKKKMLKLTEWITDMMMIGNSFQMFF